jgi:regulator of cell morphogenesis and NO signaling
MPAITTAPLDAPEDTAALIRLIVDRYHAAHRRDLPVLIGLAREVEAKHRSHPAVPRGLADLLAQVAFEMEQHMRKEEDGLFPMILEGHASLATPIEIMRDEHEDHGTRLARVEALTRGHTAPDDAGEAWRALCAGTARLARELREHIHLEDEVLFPRAGG